MTEIILYAVCLALVVLVARYVLKKFEKSNFVPEKDEDILDRH